jgi:hypothetical protein
VFIGPYSLRPRIVDTLTIVRPETVVRWHGAGFRLGWGQSPVVCTKRWRRRARRCGTKVEAVNLYSGLRGKTEDVFVDFGHLNAAGHRILAKEIANLVLNSATA